jgi:hypothetical protein
VLLPVVAITFIHTLPGALSHPAHPDLLYLRPPWVNRSRISSAITGSPAGAAVSVLVFMTIWIRQIVLVDGARIRPCSTSQLAQRPRRG